MVAELGEKCGLIVPPDRQAWWEKRHNELGDEIWQQYPTTVEECDKALVIGAIYPEMTRVRVSGRVREFEPERGFPIFSFWDLGSSDNMAGWLIQPAGKDINVLDFCCAEGAGAAGVAEVIRAWKREHGRVARHFLPHDAHTHDKGSGKTYLTQLVECGIPAPQVVVVPRTPDIWVGIDEVRRRLPKMWFHARTDREVRSADGQKLASGVGRLEAYRKHVSAGTGFVRSMPVKDGICDHTADALRVFAEADSLGLVCGPAPSAAMRSPVGQVRAILAHAGEGGPQRAIMGSRMW